MTEIVPAQYQQELSNRWSAYYLAPDGSSLKNTALLILNITLDKCSVALGHPKMPRPTVVNTDGVLPEPPELEYAA